MEELEALGCRGAAQPRGRARAAGSIKQAGAATLGRRSEEVQEAQGGDDSRSGALRMCVCRGSKSIKVQEKARAGGGLAEVSKVIGSIIVGSNGLWSEAAVNEARIHLGKTMGRRKAGAEGVLLDSLMGGGEAIPTTLEGGEDREIIGGEGRAASEGEDPPTEAPPNGGK